MNSLLIIFQHVSYAVAAVLKKGIFAPVEAVKPCPGRNETLPKSLWSKLINKKIKFWTFINAIRMKN